MTTTRATTPQVNLKDRIAALQQRSSSATHSGPVSTSGGTGSLRDKIANFERKGAVPAPRGRFGANTPLGEDASSKKRGELYGNRVPELAKPSPEAVLATRRRTISTSSSTHPSRPTSPSPDHAESSEPPVPPVPTALAYVGRRVASDILPRRQPTLDIDLETPVSAEKFVPDATSPAKDESAPKITVSSVETLQAPSPEDTATSKISVVELAAAEHKAQKPDVAQLEDATPKTESKPVEELSSLTSMEIDSSADLPPISTAPSEIPESRLTVNTEDGELSGGDDATASSYSVPTPSDNSFMVEPPKDEAAKSDPLNATAGTELQSVPEVPTQPSVPVTPAHPATKVMLISRISDDKGTEPEGLAPVVEVKPASKVDETARSQPTAQPSSDIVTPPSEPKVAAPRPKTPLSPPPTPAPTVERKVQPSFNVVIHRKVRESSSSEPAPPMPPPSRITLIQPKTPIVTRVAQTSVAGPQSPSIGDLAALVFDAALLEEQLSGTSTPTKLSASPQPLSSSLPPAPTVNVEVAIPEPVVVSEPVMKNAERPTGSNYQNSELSYDRPELAPVVEDEILESPPIPEPAAHGASVIPTPRVVTSSDPHASSAVKESTSHRFSTFRPRKGSVPGAHRNSVASEISEESTVLVSRPTSSPPPSDTSSVRSSSKSWKSPKKGIGRASSWLFRGKNKTPTIITEDANASDAPPSPSLLSPYPPANGRPPSSARPTSWTSMGSSIGDMFDPELVNSFPSVPGGNQSSMHLRARTLPPSPASSHSQLAPNRPHSVGHASGRKQSALL